MEEALKIINNLKPDIFITDIFIKGIEVMGLIKTIKESFIGTRVIVLSEFDNFKYVREAFINGAIDYLLKPINEKELLGILNKVNEEIKAEKTKNLKYKNGKKVIQEAKFYINEHYNNDISLKLVAEHVFLNANYFSTLFKEETGINFIDYLIDTRIVAAKELLKQPGVKIYEVARIVGYEEVASFNRVFKKNVGVTPKEYVNLSIHYHS